MTYGDEDLFKQYGYTDDSEQSTPVIKQSNSNTNTQTNVDDLFAQYGYDGNKYSEPQTQDAQPQDTISYNPNNNAYNIQITQNTYKPKHPFLTKLQRPFLRKGTKERKDFLSQYNDTNVPSYDEIGEMYRSGQIDKNRMKELSERRKLLDHYSSEEDFQKTKNRNVGKGAFELALAAVPLGVGGLVTKGVGALTKKLITRQAVKKLGTLGTRAAANGLAVAGHAGAGAAEGAGFGALDYAFDKATGAEPEDSLGERMKEYAGMGAIMGTGISGLGIAGKTIARSKAGKWAGNKVNEAINSNERLSHIAANAKNILGTRVGGRNDNVAKYQRFEKLLQESGLPEEEINTNLLEYSNLSARDKIRVDKAVRKQLMELERPSTERPQFFGEEPTIQTNQPTLDDLINPSGRNSFIEPQSQMQPIEKLNKIEEALNNGTPITRKAIYEATPEEYNYLANQLKQGNNWDDVQVAEFLKENGIGLKEEPIVNQGFESTPYEFNPADDINLFEQARDYNVPQNNIGYAQTPVSPKQPTLDLPKVKPNTKKTLAEWKSKYSKKNTSVEEGRPVESSGGINTNEKVETPQNKPSYQSQNEHSVKELPKKIIEPEKSLDDMGVTKLEAGEAEGANTSYNKLNRKTIKESDALDNGLTEEVPNSGRFASEDAEFNSWYDKYEKADADTRAKMLEEKANSFSKREEGLDFYNKFSEQIDRDKVVFDRNKPSGYKDLEKPYKPSVSEEDLLDFTSKFKATGTLPKIKDKESVMRAATNNNLKYKTNKDYNAFLGKINNANNLKAKEKVYNEIKDTLLNNEMTKYDYKLHKQLDDAYKYSVYTFKKKFPFLEDKNLNNEKIVKNIEKTAKLESLDKGSQYKITDFANEISSGNKEIEKTIKDLFEDNHIFKFEDLPKSSRGRTDAKTGEITINSNLSAEEQVATIKHETAHIIQKEIAKACGKDSVEYKIYMDGVEANKELHLFENENDYTVKQWQELKNIGEEKGSVEAQKAYNKLNVVDKMYMQEYYSLLDKYKNSTIEIEANGAAKNNFKFFGKDIKDYDNILRTYRGRNREISGKLQKGNRWNDTKRSSGISGQSSGIDDSISGEHRIHEGNDIKSSTDGYLEDKIIGLKGIKESNLKATKYQKYDKSTGLSPKEWLNEVKETKKNYGLTDSKARALVKRAANEIKTTSDETERLLIKRGIITEEQAANRKKMVGSSTYIADRPEYTADGKIDLTRTYEDLKEGVTGKREHRAVKNIHLENAYRNTQSYNAQAKYMNSVMDYVEKEFAKPIENGRVLSGYKAVNSKLLSNAVFGRYSKQWYETIYDGPEAISKAFKDEKVAKAWEELHKRTNTPDMQIPEEVYNSLFSGKGESAADWISRYGSKDLLKSIGKLTSAVHDAMMERFKQRVLTSASFVMNNRIGNQIMIAAHSDNPGEYIKSLYDAFKIKNSDLPAGVLESNINNEIKSFNIRKKYTGYAPLDNAFNLFGGQLLDTSTLKGMSKVSATTLNWFVGKPARAFAKWSDKVMRFNQKFEDFERRQVFAKHINKERRELVKRTGQKMITQQEFVDQINKNSPLKEAIIEDIQNTLGDYNNFSKFEKDYLKRVVPFYSWYRTISRHTYQLAKKNPTRAALIMYELDDIKNNSQEDLKEYQRGSIKTGAKNELTGDNLVINKMHAMPYMTFREDLGVNPFIQVPAEAIRGKKFFQDQEISNKRYARFYEGKDEKYYDTKTGKTLDKLPVSTRVGYVGKQLLWNNAFPYFDNPMLDVNKTSGAFFNKFSKDASKKDKGQWHMYDKSYDATVFGGFNIGDKVGTAKYKGKYNQDKEKEVIRSGKSRYRNRTALLNRAFGLSIQNENPKDYFSEKEEKESLSHKLSVARRVKAWRAKHKKK